MCAEAAREQATGIDKSANGVARHVGVAIVGSGFSGLGMAIRLKQQGREDFVLLERAMDVGGTWRDNLYPGCTCDVPSHLYSFSFAPNPNWSHRFAPQSEIWDYLRQCTRRFGIEPHISFGQEVLDASWHETSRCWRITTNAGDWTADVLVLGTGALSEPSMPDIPGLYNQFKGTVFHSAQWRPEHDLTGERVGVIGTGASAIQIVPRVQPAVGRLYVFQRTAPWILPRQDRPISEQERARFRALPLAQRLARAVIYCRLELIALGFVYRTQVLQSAERLGLRHLEAQVADPALRERLTPHYRLGCKRILLSDDYYPALCQENVELVTERIREVRSASVVTEDGREREIDAIIVATGFHATDMPLARRIRGREGRTLAEAWSLHGQQAYLGTTVSGFPNLFLLVGPNTGQGHTSMIYIIESQVAYILDGLRVMEGRDAQAVEARSDVQEAFNDEVRRRMRGTVWASGCSSWYLDKSGRNPTIWPGFTWDFRRRTRRFKPADYVMTRKGRDRDVGPAAVGLRSEPSAGGSAGE